MKKNYVLTVLCAALLAVFALAACTGSFVDPYDPDAPISGGGKDIGSGGGGSGTGTGNGTGEPGSSPSNPITKTYGQLDISGDFGRAISDGVLRERKYVKLVLGDCSATNNALGAAIFSNNPYITAIILPSSLETIGQGALAGCTSLTSITIPSRVTSIGSRAFENCTSLTSIAVASNNPNFSSQDGVLFNNNKTTLIRYPEGKSGSAYTIPGSVTSIGDYAFTYCTNLAAISVDGSNPNFSSQDGVLFNKLKTMLIQYPAGKSSSMYTIPDSVTGIGERAFSGCTSLTSVTIGAGVTGIGNYAFYDCTSLTGVTIPAGVTTIEGGAFSSCYNLTAIDVDSGNAVYSSQDGVLFNQDKTTLIQYPKGKSGAYTIPASVTSMGNRAFYGCYSLTGVTISAGVTSIGNSAFENCTSLVSVTFERLCSFAAISFDGDLRTKYLAGGVGTYTRQAAGTTWTKQTS